MNKFLDKDFKEKEYLGGKKILVTGTSGFIGSNIVCFLKTIKKYIVYAPSHAELDLCDTRLLRDYLLANKFDIVVHCANIPFKTHDDYGAMNASLHMFCNFEKNHHLYGKMIYFGSGAEYGRYTLPPLVMEECFGEIIPNDAYGFSKYIMRKIAQASKNIYDLCLFGVYGKNEDSSRRFISNNLINVLCDKPMTLSQNAMFDYIYIDDLCKILQWFIDNDQKYHVYNVCTSEPVALLDLALMINEITGKKTEIKIAEEGWQSEYSGSNDRLINEMGKFEFTDKLQSIDLMWKYYKDQSSR